MSPKPDQASLAKFSVLGRIALIQGGSAPAASGSSTVAGLGGSLPGKIGAILAVSAASLGGGWISHSWSTRPLSAAAQPRSNRRRSGGIFLQTPEAPSGPTQTLRRYAVD